MSNSLDPIQARRIWVQTVCQGYQQTTLVDKELNASIPLLSNERNRVSMQIFSKRQNQTNLIAFAIIVEFIIFMFEITGLIFNLKQYAIHDMNVSFDFSSELLIRCSAKK